MSRMQNDPIVFFEEHAARFLRGGDVQNPRQAVHDALNKDFPFGMPPEEHARHELAKNTQRKPKPLPKKTRNHVILARRGQAPFTISNARWHSTEVEQRWWHEMKFEELLRQLAKNPPEGYFIIAVTGDKRYDPSRLAFSSAQRFAICYPSGVETFDIARYQQLQQCFAGAPPELKELERFRALCIERALAADTPPLDKKLIAMAAKWEREGEVQRLYNLLLPVTELELQALTVPENRKGE